MVINTFLTGKPTKYNILPIFLRNLPLQKTYAEQPLVHECVEMSVNTLKLRPRELEHLVLITEVTKETKAWTPDNKHYLHHIDAIFKKDQKKKKYKPIRYLKDTNIKYDWPSAQIDENKYAWLKESLLWDINNTDPRDTLGKTISDWQSCRSVQSFWNAIQQYVRRILSV